MIRKKSYYKKEYVKKYNDRNKYPTIETLEDELFDREIELKSKSSANFLTSLSVTLVFLSLLANLILTNIGDESKSFYVCAILVLLIACGTLYIIIILKQLFNYYEKAVAKEELKVECVKNEIIKRKSDEFLNSQNL
ncbi:MAG: hypothetical protein PWP56_485 [Acetobacterium sp.]|nr:hypothetical protein [Acetobacterium sp.]